VTAAAPRDDADVARFLAELGLPGLVDVHVHFMPEPAQQAVWAAFDRLDDPPWPITYRTDERTRLDTLAALGVVAHTALAYAHRPGMAAWLNQHTLGLAAREPRVVPTFTFHPEDGVDEYVDAALDAGGRCAKVHLQVGKFDTTDPRLDAVWARLESAGTAVVLHAAAVYGGAGGEEWCGIRAVDRLLTAHPGLRLVIAHFGAPDVLDFLALCEATPTVALDTAMVFTDPPYVGEVGWDLLPRIAALADRIAFGSDFPTIPHRYAAQVRGVAHLGLGDDWLRAVLWDTPRRLLGLA
jgi:uncharacterized protein